jgi:hypothetical protein
MMSAELKDILVAAFILLCFGAFFSGATLLFGI